MKDGFYLTYTDESLLRRYKTLKSFFRYKKNVRRVKEFRRYYLTLRKEYNSDGIRWFHRGKYKIEVIIEGKDGYPYYNIASFVLFSSFSDAILYMALCERDAINILKERDRIKCQKDANLQKR